MRCYRNGSVEMADAATRGSFFELMMTRNQHYAWKKCFAVLVASVCCRYHVHSQLTVAAVFCQAGNAAVMSANSRCSEHKDHQQIRRLHIHFIIACRPLKGPDNSQTVQPPGHSAVTPTLSTTRQRGYMCWHTSTGLRHKHAFGHS
jgi:hypothetical protein